MKHSTIQRSIVCILFALLLIFVFALQSNAEEVRKSNHDYIRIPSNSDPSHIAVLLHGGSGHPTAFFRDNILETADQLGIILVLPTYESTAFPLSDDPEAIANNITDICYPLMEEFNVQPDTILVGGFSFGADETARISQYLPWVENWLYLSPNQGPTAQQVFDNGNIMVYAGQYEKLTVNEFIEDAELDVVPNLVEMTGHTWKVWERGILDSFDLLFSQNPHLLETESPTTFSTEQLTEHTVASYQTVFCAETGDELTITAPLVAEEIEETTTLINYIKNNSQKITSILIPILLSIAGTGFFVLYLDQLKNKKN